MRITLEMIQESNIFYNTMKEREMDLRGEFVFVCLV